MNMNDELLNNTFFDKMAQQKLNDEIWAFMYHIPSIEHLPYKVIYGLLAAS